MSSILYIFLEHFNAINRNKKKTCLVDIENGTMKVLFVKIEFVTWSIYISGGWLGAILEETISK